MFGVDRLGTEELLDLQEEILARLPEEITAILVKLSANGSLKITKTNFRESLETLIDPGFLTA